MNCKAVPAAAVAHGRATHAGFEVGARLRGITSSSRFGVGRGAEDPTL
jgi:hypothetical protein